MFENKGLIIQAISERRVIQYHYKDRDRIGNPHLLGFRNGRMLVEMFQTGGDTSYGQLPDWRNTHLDDIQGLSITDEVFVPELDFNPNREDYYEEIFASVN